MMGVYQIRNIKNNKVYVGSSINLEQRKSTHFSALKNNNHHSIKLQRAYLKNPEDFVFEVLEEVFDKNILFEIEQKWIDKLDAFDNGYNCTRIVGDFKTTVEAEKKNENREVWKKLIYQLNHYNKFSFSFDKYKKIIDFKYAISMNKFLLYATELINNNFTNCIAHFRFTKHKYPYVTMYMSDSTYCSTIIFDNYKKDSPYVEECNYSNLNYVPTLTYEPRDFSEIYNKYFLDKTST